MVAEALANAIAAYHIEVSSDGPASEDAEANANAVDEAYSELMDLAERETLLRAEQELWFDCDRRMPKEEARNPRSPASGAHTRRCGPC